MLYMAGLWKEFAGERRYVILTTAANTSVSDIHDRMPVVLLPDQLDAWVRDKDKVLNILTGDHPMLEKTAV
ncbi:SOS response-associated peptidase family protein [Solibaculum intestinale]|uniref:SOS response-associated peptidase family protein n=1 Tax=Solibaculum intestinale TaxID=3133165 RepID=A0ABV1E3Y9_9FIRM